jgi:hypothetical protein
VRKFVFTTPANEAACLSKRHLTTVKAVSKATAGLCNSEGEGGVYLRLSPEQYARLRRAEAPFKK